MDKTLFIVFLIINAILLSAGWFMVAKKHQQPIQGIPGLSQQNTSSCSEPFVQDPIFTAELNKAYGIGPCASLDIHRARLSEDAAQGHQEFIQNLRIRRDPQNDRQCYILATDPILAQNGGCDPATNPHLQLALSKGILNSVRLDQSNGPKDLKLPKDRCVFEVAYEPTPTPEAMDIMWRDWNRTECTLVTKPFRDALDQIMAQYRQTYAEHQQTLAYITTTRNQLQLNTTLFESCTAEDTALDTDLPYATAQRKTCDDELARLSTNLTTLTSSCDQQHHKDKVTITAHTTTLAELKTRLEAAAKVYREADQEFHQKHSLLTATEQHNASQHTKLKDTNQEINQDFTPRRDTLLNTQSTLQTNLSQCQSKNAALTTDVQTALHDLTTCEEANLQCQTNLSSTRAQVKDGNMRFTTLVNKERELRQELLALQAKAQACQTQLTQCHTDRTQHTIEVEELRRRLAQCLANKDNLRNQGDQDAINTMDTLKTQIAQRADQDGRKCDLEPQTPQPPIQATAPSRNLY